MLRKKILIHKGFEFSGAQIFYKGQEVTEEVAQYIIEKTEEGLLDACDAWEEEELSNEITIVVSPMTSLELEQKYFNKNVPEELSFNLMINALDSNTDLLSEIDELIKNNDIKNKKTTIC